MEGAWDSVEFQFQFGPLEGWSNLGFWWILLLCVSINLIAVFAVGLIFESRLLPLNPDYQFLGFFPGSLGQALALAGLLKATQHAHVPALLNSVVVQAFVCTFAFVLAFRRNRKEHNEGIYSTRAWWSPTKFYRNKVLRPIFSFPLIMSFLAVASSLVIAFSWHVLAWLIIAGFGELFWLVLHLIDGRRDFEEREEIRFNAHIDDWVPCWRRRGDV